MLRTIRAMTSRLNLRALCAAITIGLAACSARSNPPLLPAAHPLVHAPSSGAALLYVSDPVANDVEVYSAAGHDQAPALTITDGIKAPAGLTTDGSGNLFVANTAANTVTEYAPKTTSPSATYSNGVLGPVSVAVDGNGTLYVANFYSFAASIVEFSSGSKNPSVTIGDPCSCYPVGLTLDASDNLYVAYDDYYEQTLVFEYPKGSTKGTELDYQMGRTRWESAGLAVDSSSRMIVAVATLPGIEVFQSGEYPVRTFGKQGSPRFVALNASQGDLFVTDTARKAVEEYVYATGRLRDVVTKGLKSVYGVALSP